MPGYTIAANRGDESPEIAFNTGALGITNFLFTVNDAVSRDEAIRMVETMIRRLEASDTADPPVTPS